MSPGGWGVRRRAGAGSASGAAGGCCSDRRTRRGRAADASSGDQEAVEAFAADVPIQRSAIALARGAWTGVWMMRTPTAVNTASKAAVNLASRSRIRNWKRRRVVEVHQQVAGLLGHPGAGGVGGDARRGARGGVACSMTKARRAGAGRRVDMEEVGGEDRWAWAARNCAPGLAAARRGAGSMPAALRIFQTVDGGDLVSEAGEFAVDAPVAPGRVLAGHGAAPERDSPRGRAVGRARSRVGPAAGDEVGVPAQQRARGDDQAQLAALLQGSAGPARIGSRGRPRRVWVRAPACSVIVRLCPNRGRGGRGLRREWCGPAGLRGRAGSQRL